MKIVLISLFILLLIYLIIYMIGGASDQPSSERHSAETKNFKSALILDELISLNDKELYELKDDLQDIKALLESNQPYYAKENELKGVFPKVSSVRTINKMSGRELSKKIRRDINRMDRKTYGQRPGHFSKGRIILVQILLIIITVLMIIL